VTWGEERDLEASGWLAVKFIFCGVQSFDSEATRILYTAVQSLAGLQACKSVSHPTRMLSERLTHEKLSHIATRLWLFARRETMTLPQSR